MVGAGAERVGLWRSLGACQNSHSGRICSLHARVQAPLSITRLHTVAAAAPGGFPALARLLLATLGSAPAEELERPTSAPRRR